MNTYKNIAVYVVMLSMITPSFAFAELDSSAKKLVYSCVINVSTGITDCTGSVEVLESDAGKIKAKAALCSVDGQDKVTEVEFLAHMGSRPIGWLLNVGDSSTNNGYGGDWGDNEITNPWQAGQESTGQSHDAEIQLNGNLAGDQQSWSVWGDDTTQGAVDGYRRLFAEGNMDFANKTVRVLVRNNAAEMEVIDSGVPAKVLTSPYLFALNGQPDFQGPTNCDVYLGINRVIEGLYRVGSGVEKVEVRLYSQPISTVVATNESLVDQLYKITQVKSQNALPNGIIASLSPSSYTKISSLLSKLGIHPESANIAMLGNTDRARQMTIETMRAQGLIVANKAPTPSSVRKALRRFQRRVAIPRVTSPEMAVELLAADKVGDVK